ncbi:MAG TPA: lysylphosphatidylglycerol synthase transmembrane domain-containing protein [Planctomycetota bacterium]|nr:lysylphosphatidylglycerol synthase transmembrane domain-containing protein [Planctomycetota bacterium]
MSPNVKRWGVPLVRIAVTAAAVVFVVRMIRWHDYWIVTEKATDKPAYYDAAAIRSADVAPGSPGSVTWADGRHTPVWRAARREGFLSLFHQTNKPLFFAMLVCTLVPMFFLAQRWWLLLRGHGFQVPLGQIFFVTYAGAFFNNFLPGSVGGDLTKAILASSGEARKAAVAGTVILDRIIGLSVMILLGAVSLTPELQFYWSPSGDRRLVYLIYGLLGTLVLGYLVYFSPPFRLLVGRLPFKKVVAELDEVFRSARQKKALVAKGAILSLLAQASGILVIFGLAHAMGIPALQLVKFFIFEPIIFIVTALPISMGGWGVQEYVYQRLFGDFGGMDPNHAIALSVLYKLTLILASIPGGLLFALGAARRRGTPADAV